MSVLYDVQPQEVFRYFEEICAIPHGSGNTDAISAYCVNFAKKRGLYCERDAWNNVIIRKPASPGYECAPTVILQGHLDMVCEKDPDCPLNMETDGLQLQRNGDWVSAKGTTLGGDDGIAVAMALAILDDASLCHPALEVLFTTDEETGMYGAAGLDGARLHGRLLLNIDSEQEGVLTVGCAGGARAEIAVPVQRERLDKPCFCVTVSGLIGGHSGVEIDKGRLNANTVLGAFLKSLDAPFRVVSMSGGNKDNAIPRTASCVLWYEEDLAQKATAFAARAAVETDPDLTVTVTAADTAHLALTQAASCRVADFLVTVPNGIVSMSKDIEGLVQTSLNLGVLTLNEELTATFAVRSSLSNEKEQLKNQLVRCAETFGGKATFHGEYPAWEYRKDSVLREVMVGTYERLYDKTPIVEIIHAGLECGLLSEKMDGLDAVSIGPDMADIHTTRERLSISSVERTYRYVCETLKALKG